MKRSATANWKGSGKEGSGKLLTASGVIKNKPMIIAAVLKVDPYKS
jgi:hypothetical protein